MYLYIKFIDYTLTLNGTVFEHPDAYRDCAWL